MYNPPHFEEVRPEELYRIIREYPLGALVVNGPHGLDANHLPFEFAPQSGPHGVLRAHVARANSVWQDVQDGDAVLVIFRAAEAYISPNWYPSKHELHRQVPTWNYQAVHVHGRITIRDDEKFVRGVVARLTHAHEHRVSAAEPWRMIDSSKAYIDQMLAAIVGIEIEISQLVGKSKLGQNKEERDRLSAAEALHARGQEAISAAMLNSSR